MRTCTILYVAFESSRMWLAETMPKYARELKSVRRQALNRQIEIHIVHGHDMQNGGGDMTSDTCMSRQHQFWDAYAEAPTIWLVFSFEPKNRRKPETRLYRIRRQSRQLDTRGVWRWSSKRTHTMSPLPRWDIPINLTPDLSHKYYADEEYYLE